jgi:hypothetical protein
MQADRLSAGVCQIRCHGSERDAHGNDRRQSWPDRSKKNGKHAAEHWLALGALI